MGISLDPDMQPVPGKIIVINKPIIQRVRPCFGSLSGALIRAHLWILQTEKKGEFAGDISTLDYLQT